MQVPNHLLLSSVFYDNDLDPFTPASNTPASVEQALTYGSAPHHDLAVLAKMQRTAVKEIARAVDRESYKTRSQTDNTVSFYSLNPAKAKLEGYRQHLYQLQITGLDRTAPPAQKLRQAKSVALLTMASGTRVVAGAAATGVAVVHGVKNLWLTPDKSVKKIWKRGSATRKTFRALDFFSAAQKHVLRKNSSTENIAIEANKTINTTLDYISQSGVRAADERWRERQHSAGDRNSGGGGGGGCGGGCGGGGCGG